MALTLHAVIDDEIMLAAFHDFVSRYHAEETLMFWLAVEVFKHRNWKAAKFFGMEADPLPVAKAPTIPPPASTPSKKAELERRKSRKEKAVQASVNSAVTRQRQLDQSAATRMNVTLEQLYLVKEADFIFDNFIKRDGVYWTCVDADTAREIEDNLVDPVTLKRTIFEKAQLQAFNGMNDDLMPRFIKEIIQASTQDPVPEHMKAVVDRFDELRKSPSRRKTGVSTALAFMFRRTSTEKDSKLQTISSRDQGKLMRPLTRRMSSSPMQKAAASAGADEQKPIDANKATSLLRTRSRLTLLGSEGGSLAALALSRSRLSYGHANDSPGIIIKKSSVNSNNTKSGLGQKGARDLRKRISAPETHEPNRDSLTRRMELGVQRSQSDSKLDSRAARARAKELGLDVHGGGTRSTTSRLRSGDQVTVYIDQAARKNSA